MVSKGVKRSSKNRSNKTKRSLSKNTRRSSKKTSKRVSKKRMSRSNNKTSPKRKGRRRRRRKTKTHVSKGGAIRMPSEYFGTTSGKYFNNASPGMRSSPFGKTNVRH